MQSLIKGSILSICNALEKSVKEDYDNDSPGKTIFIKFLNLLDQNKPKRMSVAEYANQLCVTPKYLTIICKRNSERTAIEWIHKYVNDEVRYYLGQTDLSLKEITHLLNFPNVSFFGRYVKQHFGVSPKTLRQNLQIAEKIRAVHYNLHRSFVYLSYTISSSHKLLIRNNRPPC